MSTKVVKKKLTDLPAYTPTLESNGVFHYREGGVDSQYPISGLLTAAQMQEPDGSSHLAYRSTTVYAVLSRVKALSDIGSTLNYLGYNPTADAAIIASRNPADEALFPSGVSICWDAYGIRRTAKALSIKVNAGAGGFNSQVTGVSGSAGLSTYNSVDDVALQCEAYSEAYTAAEDLSSTLSYGSNYFTATGLDFTKMMIGMACYTKHSTPYWGIIVGFDQTLNKVIVDQWSRGGVAYTPANDGSGIYINYKSKIWSANFTSTLSSTSKALRMTTLELGFQNGKITNPADSNGVDMVSLGLYRGTAAFYARNTAAGNNWKNGFRSAGATEGSFIAANGTEGTISPYGYVNTTQQGYISYGGNVVYHSVVRDGGLTGTILYARNGTGKLLRNPVNLTAANNDYTISLNAGSVLHGTTTVSTYTLPAAALASENIPIYNPLNKSSLVVTTADGSATIIRPDGVSVASVTLYGAHDFKAVYNGSNWYLIGLSPTTIYSEATLVISTTTVIAANTTTIKTLSVSGAALGMPVRTSCSVDSLGLGYTAYVSAAGVVSIAISNTSAASITLPACSFYFTVSYRNSVV